MSIFRKIKKTEDKKVRDSNFELLRIFAMLGIITSHFWVHSFSSSTITLDFNISVILRGILSIGCISNLIFIILTGYFMSKARPNYKKIIGLILEMYFYSICIALLAHFVLGKDLSLSNLKRTLLPFPFGNWFCVMYIALYLLTPFLNKLIDSVDKGMYKKLLLVCFGLFSVVPVIFLRNPGFSELSVFVLGYFIGAYLRKYPLDIGKKKVRLLFFASLVITQLSVIVLYVLGIVFKKAICVQHMNYLTGNQSPLVIITAVFAFLWFEKIKIEPNRIINTIAMSTLGVYLIHDNDIMRSIIWRDVVHPDLYGNSVTEVICIYLVKLIAVYAVCVVIDLLRIKLFGKIEKQVSNSIYTKLLKAKTHIVRKAK